MNTVLEVQALEAAAVSAETWNKDQHGDCRSRYYHCGKGPPGYVFGFAVPLSGEFG